MTEWTENDAGPPGCPECGGRLRPDVVWFGESLPEGAFEHASRASEECDLFFSVGTSTMVYPAASLPFRALQHGATVVEINPEATTLTANARYSFREKSGEFLPGLVNTAWPAQG